MSYTSPSNSDADWIRFRIGDTDTSNEILSDTEIGDALTEQTDRVLAAAMCAEAIAAEFARKAIDLKMGKLHADRRALADHYWKLAEQLRTESGSYAEPFIGGQTYSAKTTLRENTDLVPPRFERDQFDIEGDKQREPENNNS